MCNGSHNGPQGRRHFCVSERKTTLLKDAADQLSCDCRHRPCLRYGKLHSLHAALAKSRHERQQLREDVEDCMTQLLLKLPPLFPQLTANHASAILMPLSKIHMPVSEHLQGLAVKLFQKLATGDANARDIARALGALAQWDMQVLHDPTHAAVTRAVIQRFATTLHPSGGQQPSSSKEAPTGKETAQFLLSAIKVKLRLTDEVLDATSAHMVALMQRPSTYTDEARSIAAVLQTFYQLRYSPTTHQASHLLERFVTLCNTSPPAQAAMRDIEIVVVAVAGLG